MAGQSLQEVLSRQGPLDVDDAIVLRDAEGTTRFASRAAMPADLLDAEGVHVRAGERPETWLVQQRVLELATGRHQLTVARRLTDSIDAAEVASWKNLIRALSHELNNSLAPMSSLLFTVEKILDKPQHRDRLGQAVQSLQLRVAHLSAFLEDYVALARIPKPRLECVSWEDLLCGLGALMPFEVVGTVSGFGVFDRGQIEQAVINLLKNAREAGSPEDAIQLSLAESKGGWLLTVADRGGGVSEEVLQQATTPFFSTRADGAGLGLSLCREIAINHGGWFALSPREGGGAEARLWLPATDSGQAS